MERIDIFQKLRRQEAEAFSKLTSEERQVISQYQERLKKMKEQNSRRSVLTSDISKQREGSSDHIYSNLKEREERRNISEQRDSYSRNKAITPQFSQNRSFHNDIMMKPYHEESRKHPDKVLQPEVMSPSFHAHRPRQEERRREHSLTRKRSQEELSKEIDSAFQTFAPQAHRLEAENNYIRFRQEKALRNESLRASRIPPRPLQLEVSRNCNIRSHQQEALSLSYQQKREDCCSQVRVRPSSAKESKPPFIVPSRLTNRKGKHISESAFQKMKEYGNKVLNFHRSRLQRSNQGSDTYEKCRENRSQILPRTDSATLLTEPGSRTNKYSEAKKQGFHNSRQEMKRAGVFLQKEMHATRKRGFTNSSDQKRETQYTFPYPPLREPPSRKVDLSFQEPRASKIRHISPLREIQNFSSKELNSDLHRHNVSQFTLGPKQSIDEGKNSKNQQRVTTPRRKGTLQNSSEKNQVRSGGNNKSFMNHTFTSYQAQNLTAKTQRRTKIRACCAKNVRETQQHRKVYEKKKKEGEERRVKSRAQDMTMIEKEKVERTKVQLYSIISRLTNHLKICNNFAHELEKIEFDKI